MEKIYESANNQKGYKMRVSPILSNCYTINKTQNINDNHLKKTQNMAFPASSSKNVSFGSGIVIETIKLFGKLITKAYSKPDVFTDVIDPVLKKSNYVKKNINTTLEYFNSNAGKKIQRKLEYDMNGNFLADTRFLYKPNSKNNELLKTFNYDKDGNLLWETRYKYDDSGQKIHTANYDRDGKLLHTSDYKYSSYSDFNDMDVTDKTPDGEIIKQLSYIKKVNESDYELRTESSSNAKYIREFMAANKNLGTFPKNLSDNTNFDNLKIDCLRKIFNENGDLSCVEYSFELPENTNQKYIKNLSMYLNDKNDVAEYGVEFYDPNAPSYNYSQTSNARYSKEGLLKTISSYAENIIYYEDGKTVKEINAFNVVAGKTVKSKEFYPNGQLKTEYRYYDFFGGSGASGVPKVSITTFSEDGKQLSYSDSYL